MGFLERAIRRGISEGVGKAVGEAVEKAVTPKAAEYANRTAAQPEQAANTAAQPAARAAGGLEGALSGLQRSAESYATQMSKNLKLCPACGASAGLEQKFCPRCGAKLPEESLAQSAVCPACGKQNTVGTRFCAECGTKLPGALAEEAAVQAKNEAILAQWNTLLPEYPPWRCGGAELSLETEYNGAAAFHTLSVRFPDGRGAEPALQQYCQLLRQDGFREAGQYPSAQHLYKLSGGVCCHVDAEHCFDGGSDCLTLLFDHSEPGGGFDYAKPAPKKPFGLRELLK